MPELANRDRYESAIVAALEPIFQAQFRRALDSPTNIPYAEFQAALESTMRDQLRAVFTAAGGFLMFSGTVMVSASMFEGRADTWATGFAHQLAAEVVANSREAATAAVNLAGATSGTGHAGADQVKLAQALALVFMSDARIQNIAITEVTRATSAGEQSVVLIFNEELARGGGAFSSGRKREAGEPVQPGDEVEAAAGFGSTTTNAAGEKLVAVWVTEHDSRVCPICRPLDGHSEIVYGRVAPGGPPAHPRCRCNLRWVKASQVAAA